MAIIIFFLLRYSYSFPSSLLPLKKKKKNMRPIFTVLLLTTMHSFIYTRIYIQI